MRKVFSVALMAAMLCLVGITKDAGATVTIELEWAACGGGTGCTGGIGTDTITVGLGGGQTLRLDIFLSHDLTQGEESHTFSLNFDTALDNELNFLGGMAPLEWVGTDVDPGAGINTYGPLTGGVTTLESSGVVAGRVNSFESAGFANLPRNGAAYTVGTSTATAPARYRVGQVFFSTNTVTTDGLDVFTGLFNGLFDILIDGNSVAIPPGTITFDTASVNVIPEPGTVSLLGLGLVGLVLAGRRSRRS